MHKKPATLGFTLIELLVVISVIGMLAALLLANFVGVRGRAADTTLKNNANQLKTALRLYYNDYQQFPGSSSGAILGCGADGTSTCQAGQAFSAGPNSSMYMPEIPTDISYYSDGLDSFLIVVELSNLSDQGIAESITQCTPENRAYISGELPANAYVVCE